MSRRLVGALVAFWAVVLCSGAKATEPILFIVSYHNLDYARVACDQVMQSEPEARQTVKRDQQLGWDIDDTTKYILAATAQCRSVRDPRELGRKLENELIDALAVNTKCGGVTVMREPHPDYDHGSDTAEVLKVRPRSSHWDLHIDYDPGSKVYGCSLFPNDPGPKMAEPFVTGEGDTAKNTDQIWVVVTRKGATIR